MIKKTYCGCFIPLDDVRRAIKHIQYDRLDIEIQNPHITLQYKPKDYHEEFLGIPIQVTVIGYGRDCDNEGLLVRTHSDVEELNHLFHTIKNPHITLSKSQHGASINTAYLDFQPCEPFFLEGVYGIFTDTGIITNKEDLLIKQTRG